MIKVEFDTKNRVNVKDIPSGSLFTVDSIPNSLYYKICWDGSGLVCRLDLEDYWVDAGFDRLNWPDCRVVKGKVVVE